MVMIKCNLLNIIQIYYASVIFTYAVCFIYTKEIFTLFKYFTFNQILKWIITCINLKFSGINRNAVF